MAKASIISEQLKPDTRVSLAARYQLDQTDRQYIDDQIVSMQSLLATGQLRGQLVTRFPTDVLLQPGDIACASPVAAVETAETAERRITLGNADGLAAAGIALGIVTEVTPPGGFAPVAMIGIVGNAITGLPAGDPGLVRVSSTGRPERVASFSASDVPLGYVDGVGNLTLQGNSGSAGPEGPQGEPGAPGAPGVGTDPTSGDPGFTAGDTGVLLRSLTLDAGKHYQVVFRGLNYNATLANGVRSRPFDITVCVSTLTGAAVLQSPTVGQPQPTSGSGQVEFAVSGLAVEARLYGGSPDTEWFGPLEIVTEYDPAVQIPAGWTPDDEASCKFAFDPAIALVHTGGLVDSWGGQIGAVSGAGVTTTRPTRVASHPALNNQPTVRFDNAHGLLITGLSNAAADYMFFAVLDIIGLDTDSYLLDCQTGRLLLSVDRSGGNYAWLDSSASFRTAPGAATGPQKLGYMMQASDKGRIRKNGVDANTGMLYTQTAIGGTIRMGRQYSSASAHLNAHVGYFCCFAGVSEQIRFRTEKYFQTRFGV